MFSKITLRLSACERCSATALYFMLTHFAIAQTSPQPTPLPGLTSVTFDGSSYVFNASGVRYNYSIAENESARGTLRDLTATVRGITFWPSNFGGVKAYLAGRIRNPISLDPAVHHSLVASGFRGRDTVFATWVMSVDHDSCQYSFNFHLAGQTLVIEFNGDNEGKASGIDFSNASPYSGTRVISLPCLTLTNVLFIPSCDSFVSLFVDWENSNASAIAAWVDEVDTTGYYSQHIEYEELANHRRNQLRETVYLSVSSDLKDVLPNVVPPPSHPIAPFRNALLQRMVISYFPPFPLLNNPGTYLDKLYFSYGVRDVAFLVKNWNCGQFDHNYPRIWPPDSFSGGCYGAFPKVNGGVRGLQALDSNLTRKGYLFGLHENYVDYYDRPSSPCNSPVVTRARHGLLSDGSFAHAFCRDRICESGLKERSYLLKPSDAARVALQAEDEVKKGLAPELPPRWCYLDVSSSVNPSGPSINQYMEGPSNPKRSYVDFDQSLGADAGKFAGTVRAYRNLAAAVRSSYGGPVQGEGGNHMLYAGYFDGFEGRLKTGAGYVYGYAAPLILEFAQKIRDKSAISGVGHIQWFFGSPEGTMNDTVTEARVKIFMATELAYGHGGLVTTNSNTTLWEHSLEHAQWEQSFLLPVQRMYANAKPVSVSYFDHAGPHSASEYIKDHIRSYNIIGDSTNFMGRVRVVYDNGVEIWVNRSRGIWNVGTVGNGSGWYCYNARIGGLDSLGQGTQPIASFILPAEYGWVCYSPVAPSGPR